MVKVAKWFPESNLPAHSCRGYTHCVRCEKVKLDCAFHASLTQTHVRLIQKQVIKVALNFIDKMKLKV